MKKLTMKKLVELVARREKVKSSAGIRAIKERLDVLSDFVYRDSTNVMLVLFDNGFTRARDQARKEALRAEDSIDLE